MKSVEGTVAAQGSDRREMNLKLQATLILQTLSAMGKAYGPTYLAQFLTSDRHLVYRHVSHQDIETRGKLARLEVEQVLPVIHYLVDAGLLIPSSPECNAVELTQSGRAWLEEPQDLLVDRERVRFSQFERLLRSALRDHRRQLAETHELKPWQILTDYTMDRIVLIKPLSLDALRNVPGLDLARCERYGVGIVEVVQNIIAHYEDFVQASRMVKITRGSYPQVKQLFLDGVTVNEMARLCGIKPGTVCSYLRELHLANAIDLIPWIEATLNKKALFKASEYFERVQGANLKEGYHILGLDYETLLFARLYARDKQLQAQSAYNRAG